jgi:peptidoglycan DL-endopeptidase CwlO
VRRLISIGAIAAVCLAAGCAAKRGAVPRPFPGAPVVASEPADAASPSPLASVVATAMMLQGAPYKNGGTDPSGFDCSGFVQYVFAKHGRALPREVRDQFRIGTAVDRRDVRPGDLVFFQTVSPGASHVGIVVGPDQFVHAPSSRGVVRVERYTTGYWAMRWVGAKRPG